MAYDNSTSQLYLVLMVFGSGALIIALYCFLKIVWSDGGHRAGRRHRPPVSMTFISRPEEPPSSTENSMTDLIPAHKYQKGAGTLVGEDGGINTCAVCLCDFEEGEELRTLPECTHSFHVPCIDMWLYSHSTCPICRTHAITSLPQVLQRLSNNHSPTLPPPPLPPPPPASHHGSTVTPDLVGNILV